MTTNLEQLERLARLREQGHLTDAEFEAQKAKLSAPVADKPTVVGRTVPPHFRDIGDLITTAGPRRRAAWLGVSLAVLAGAVALTGGLIIARQKISSPAVAAPTATAIEAEGTAVANSAPMLVPAGAPWGITPDMSYPEARQLLLEHGFKPLAFKFKEQDAPSSNPEMASCGGGMGGVAIFCEGVFQNPGRTGYVVVYVTYPETENGDPDPGRIQSISPTTAQFNTPASLVDPSPSGETGENLLPVKHGWAADSDAVSLLEDNFTSTLAQVGDDTVEVNTQAFVKAMRQNGFAVTGYAFTDKQAFREAYPSNQPNRVAFEKAGAPPVVIAFRFRAYSNTATVDTIKIGKAEIEGEAVVQFLAEGKAPA